MRHLVLLHGWGARGAVWRHQVEAFKRACIVHTPTLPGWEAAWVAEFLESLPPAQTLAVGWSLGGMLILEALAATPWKPAGLILVGVPAVFCPRDGHPWGQPPAAVRAMRRALAKNPRKVLADFASACLARGEDPFEHEVKALFDPDPAGDHLAAGLDYLLQADLRPVLAKIPGPAVIVQGEADGIVAPAQARFLHRHLLGSRLVILSGAGHVPFITQTAQFNEILKEVLQVSQGDAVFSGSRQSRNLGGGGPGWGPEFP